MNGLDHPLNGRPGGYYQGSVPLVPWTTGYDLTNLDTTRFPLKANSWGTKYFVPDMVSPLLAEGEEPST
jgi:hypothetical protein